MGFAGTDAVEKVLLAALENVHPGKEVETAKRIIDVFECECDFDTANELEDSSSHSIAEAAREMCVGSDYDD